MKKTIVHIVGTGTIGEPLIGLFTDFRRKDGHRRGHLPQAHAARLRPLEDQPPDVARRQAGDRLRPARRLREARPQGPLRDRRGAGARHGGDRLHARRQRDEGASTTTSIQGPKGFLAQGSEFGFGKPYARGINDEVLVPGQDRFIQVVSCNTHNITTLIKTLCRRAATAATASTAAPSSACGGRTTSRRPRTSSPRRRSASTTTTSSAPITPTTPTTSSRRWARSSTCSRARSSSTPSTCTRSGSTSTFNRDITRDEMVEPAARRTCAWP